MIQQGTERYTDWKVIGEGASATVYKAMDQFLGRLVAVKIIKEQFRANEMIMNSLRHEVIISRELRHPNICPIHDFYEGYMGVGIIMDLISGIELRKWLDQNRGHLLETAQQRFELFKKLLEAMSTAHTKIVHRDLKPDNIFIMDGDPTRPVIMDFGVALVGKGAGDDMIAGTAKYMSPEQWEAPNLVDKRSDLFALGIMGYEIFTDRIPPTTLKNVLKTRKPPRIPLHEIDPPSQYCAAIPASLDQVIIQMMAYEQQDRPQSAGDVLKALEGITLVGEEGGGFDFSIIGGKKEVDTERTVLVEGGVFLLGNGRGNANPNEKPVRKVTISPFRMSIYPITNREYQRFVESTGYAPPPLLHDSAFGRPNNPVVGVTYDDALAYASWAGGTLPSECQWEYAAKGGQKHPTFPWGEETPSSLHANIDWAQESTSPVGSCAAGKNPYGLYDLCGNVWEWCLDWYEPDFYGTLPAEGVVDPFNQRVSKARVLRGGSFDSSRQQGRCSFRYFAAPNSRSNAVGFRLVFAA
ncbi:MAG: SUMF1/EgtB/PvdO family nonheme iron enzyme [Magnetococcales bacterium]|nr:SUMF1/EgtB/PvdO family nonheme iron enzyme [Magnetococcales bacterium]